MSEHRDAYDKIISALQQVPSFVLFYPSLFLEETRRDNAIGAFSPQCIKLPALRNLDLETGPHRTLNLGLANRARRRVEHRRLA